MRKTLYSILSFGISFSITNANAQIEGGCGEGCSYTFEDGTLTILGTPGANTEIDTSYLDGHDFYDKTENLIVKDVSSFSWGALLEANNIKNVVFENVSSFPYPAFQFSGVENISISGENMNFGSGAFEYMENVQNFSISGTASSLGTDVFQGTNFTGKIDVTDSDGNKVESKTYASGSLVEKGIYNQGELVETKSYLPGWDERSLHLLSEAKYENGQLTEEKKYEDGYLTSEAKYENGQLTEEKKYAMMYDEGLAEDVQKLISETKYENGDKIETIYNYGYTDNYCEFYDDDCWPEYSVLLSTKTLKNGQLIGEEIYGNERYCDDEDYCALKWVVVSTNNYAQDTNIKEYNSADGSYTIKDENGNIIGFEGKRIFTIDEANQVAGKVNSVKIRYR